MNKSSFNLSYEVINDHNNYWTEFFKNESLQNKWLRTSEKNSGFYTQEEKLNNSSKKYFHYRYEDHYGEFCNATDLIFEQTFYNIKESLKEDLPTYIPIDIEDALLRVIEYQPSDQEIISGEHFDLNVITAYINSTHQGLQVKPNDTWIENDKDLFSCHFGEISQIETEGLVKPMLHRVYNHNRLDSQKRLSTVMFFSPPKSYLLKNGKTVEQYHKEKTTLNGTSIY